MRNKLTNKLFSSKVPMILLAVLISMALGAVLILLSGSDPIPAYKQLITMSFTSRSAFGDMISTFTTLLIVAIGVSVAQHGGLTNLGGNGQMIMGGIGMILVMTSPLASMGKLVWIPAFLAAFIMGGLWGMIAGAFKAYVQANEIIVSLLLNYIAAQIISYLLRGPLKTSNGTIPESELVADNLTMPLLVQNSSAHAGIFMALLMLVIYGLFMYKTRTGYQIRALGYSERAAKYSGVNRQWYHLILLTVSGGIAGIAGGMEVIGAQHRLVEGIANDMGFTSVVVALVGLMQPVGIAISALFMAILSVGAKYMQIMSKVPVALKDVLEALIVLFVLWGFSLEHKRKAAGKEGT